MKTTRKQLHDADRYFFDFQLCTYDNGWAQIDTPQDASYHGTWCHPEKFEIVNYCEGDLTHQRCETPEEFCAEIRRLDAFYNRALIDPGFNPAMKERFTSLGLADLLH